MNKRERETFLKGIKGQGRGREVKKTKVNYREQWNKRRRRRKREITLWSPGHRTRSKRNQVSLNLERIGSQALVRTQSWGSLSPGAIDVFFRRISKLSRMRRSLWSVFLFFSFEVAIILGSFHLMEPLVQWRACFEIPEIVSSDFDEVTSAACWGNVSPKSTLV